MCRPHFEMDRFKKLASCETGESPLPLPRVLNNEEIYNIYAYMLYREREGARRGGGASSCHGRIHTDRSVPGSTLAEAQHTAAFADCTIMQRDGYLGITI